MRTNQAGRICSPAAVLLAVLLVAGAVLGSCSVVSAAPASANATITTVPDGDGPVCAHETPAPDHAVTDPSRRGDGPAPDGKAAVSGRPWLGLARDGVLVAPAAGTRGPPPTAGRALLESLGIARI